jgi:hypothetical protein
MKPCPRRMLQLLAAAFTFGAWGVATADDG